MIDVQVFLGMAVILGLAFTALVCDYLREKNLELRIRVEERERLRVIIEGRRAGKPAERGARQTTSPEAGTAAEETVARSPELAVPAGFLDGPATEKLIRSPAPFKGVVVVVRAEEAPEPGPGEDLGALVGQLVQNIAQAHEALARTRSDTFLLISAGETGAAAARRIKTISERLWDYQLRAIASGNRLLNWGAVEAQGEPLADAVDAAGERLRETSQRRRTIAFNPLAYRPGVASVQSAFRRAAGSR